MRCTQPVMERFGIQGVGSFGMYSTKEEVDRPASAVINVIGMSV